MFGHPSSVYDHVVHGQPVAGRPYAARDDGLGVRVGIHVGEVELVAGDVRGVAVHAAARIVARAGEGEILVSDTTLVLAQGAGLEFEDRGIQELKGLDGEWRLFALVA
jgi:class 3 adenylate cyclase